MSFPYMNPNSVVVTPADPDANLDDVPVFRAPNPVYVTDARVFSRSAVTGANADYVTVSFHELGDASNVYANVNVAAGTNITANTWQALNVNTNEANVAAGTTVAMTVVFKTTANVNFGTTADDVIYQLDYVPGSAPSDTG